MALRTGLDGLVSEANLVGSRAGFLPPTVETQWVGGDSELELTGWWAASAMFVGSLCGGSVNFV